MARQRALEAAIGPGSRHGCEVDGVQGGDDPEEASHRSVFYALPIRTTNARADVLQAETLARHRAEERLFQAEERHHRLFETLPLGIVYQDASGEITEANMAAQRLLGLTLDQMQGRTSSDPRWQATDKEGLPLPGERHPAMIALKTRKPVRNALMSVYNPQCENKLWLKVNATPEFRDGCEAPVGVFSTFEDVTEQRRAEEALRRSEARLSGIIDSATDAIITVDSDQRILSFNRSAQTILGYTAEEIIGCPLTDLLSKRIRSCYKSHFDSFVICDIPGRARDSLGVLLARRKNGAEFPIEATLSRVTVDGEVFCTAILRDVTKREQAARALRENENRLRLALEGGRLGSWETDIPSNQVVAISATCRHHFGLPLQDPVTRYDMINAVHPEDRSRVWEGVLRAQNELRDYSTEFRVIWPDSSIHCLIASGTPFRPDATGRATRIAGITHDITEIRVREAQLRRTDEKLSAILEGAPLVLWATDTKGRFTIAVGKGLEPLGLQPNEAVGQSVFEMFCDSPVILENVERAMQGEAVTYDVQLGPTHFHCNIRPRYGPGGDFQGIIGVGIDITERKQAAQALEEQRQALIRSEMRLAEAQAIAHVGSLEVDLITGERYWSDELYRITGLDPENGPPDEEGTRAIYHPDDLPQRDEAVRALRDQGTIFRFNNRIIRPSGEIRWCYQEARVIQDRDGTPLRAVGVVADITERVESEQRFRTLFENSTDAIMVIDPQAGGAIIECNSTAVAMLDCVTKADLLGRTAMEFAPEFQPNGWPSVVPLPEIARNLRAERPSRFEWLHRSRKGREFPAEVIVSPLILGGRVLALAVARDVSDRREAEKALRESEQRLNLAQSVAHVGSFEGDLLTGERLWSDELYRIAGIDPKKGPLDDEALEKLFHPDDLAERNSAHANLLATGEPLRLDSRIIRPDGDIRYCHQEVIAVRGPGGRISRVVGTVADITERVESEEKFRLLFEHSANPVFLVDLENQNQIIDCNRAFVTLLGYSDHKEILGHPPYRFSPPFQPDGWPSNELRPELRQALREGRSLRFEWVHQTRDGRDVPVEVDSTHIIIGGRTLHLVVLHDLTERRRAEAALRESEHRLRMALECGELGVWDLDIVTNSFHNITDRVKTLFGVPVEADFSWEECQARMDPDDLREISRLIEEGVQQGTPANVEYRVRHPDGSIHWLRSFGAPIINPDGSITRLVGVTQDITEQKRREQKSETALRKAEERADLDSLTGLLNHRAFHRELRAGLENAAKAQTPAALAILDLDNFKFFNEVYGYGTGDDVLRLVAERLRDICSPGDTLARFGGDEFALLCSNLPEGLEGLTSAQFEGHLQSLLAGLEYHPTDSEYSIPLTLSVGASAWLPEQWQSAPDCRRAMESAEERLRRAKSGADVEGEAQRIRAAVGRQVAGFPMLDALVAAVDNKDRYTRRRSEDVLTYSTMIARQIGMSDPEIETVAIAALLHDVGKIGVPDAVLRKPGRLTPEEFAAIRQHPQMGAVIVAAVPGLEATLDAVRHHHECWDGSGYPAGLSGENIPLTARLMAVADAFSAMTTSRPYRRNITREEAIAILKAGAGTQWDPTCVEAFLRALTGSR